MVLMVLACITGCGNETTNDNNSNNNSNNYSFNDLEKDLKSLDSDIQINKKEASLIGANEGYGYISKNCTIEVYKFDKTTDKYKEAEKNQEINLESFNMKMKATVKNGYAYYVNASKSECDDVITYVEKLVK